VARIDQGDALLLLVESEQAFEKAETLLGHR
jgi:hypothetical protein